MTYYSPIARVCSRCHTANVAEARFCTRCGQRLFVRDRAARLATISLVLGVVGLPAAMTVFPSIIAFIFGLAALRQARIDSPPFVRTFATVGMALGVVGTITSLMMYF